MKKFIIEILCILPACAMLNEAADTWSVKWWFGFGAMMLFRIGTEVSDEFTRGMTYFRQ